MDIQVFDVAEQIKVADYVVLVSGLSRPHVKALYDEIHVQLISDKQPRTLSTDQLIARYLYCLEQLGAPEWKSQFKGDFTEAFKQLDAELAAHRTQ